MGRGWRAKLYLTVEQKDNLEKIARNGYAPAKKILHAQILVMCNEAVTTNRNWTIIRHYN